MKRINTIYVTLPLLKEKKFLLNKAFFCNTEQLYTNNNVKSHQINKEQ